MSFAGRGGKRHSMTLRSTPALSPFPSPAVPAAHGLAPMQPMAAPLAPPSRPVVAKQVVAKKAPADPSTRGRYLAARERDDSRVSSGTVGASVHGFEIHSRQVRQQWRNSSKAVTAVPTPFGQTNLSKFPTSDPAPKVTTVKKHYQNESVGHKYSELTEALVPPSLPASRKRPREQEVAGALLEAIKTNKAPAGMQAVIRAGKQSNAAAKLLAISHISEPERVGGSSKDFRRTLTRVKKGKASFDDAFVGTTSEPPLFGMARNPKTTRRALGIAPFKKAHTPTSFQAIDSDYSDDSDDGP